MGRTLLTGESVAPTQLNTKQQLRQAPAPTEERLRRTRSRAYLDAVGRLDSGGKILNPDALSRIRDAIASEFPDGPGSWPLGWVAKCYLGAPYEVHILDLSGQIVQHFKRGEPMPGGLDRARSLAASGHYLTIEVFSDRMVAINPDGSTSVSSF